MQPRTLRLIVGVPLLGALLLGLTACGPSVDSPTCEQGKTGATYTIRVSNPTDDKTYTTRLKVSKSKLDLSRDGEKMTLGPGESSTYTVTIKKGESRHVGVFWPGPKGDDTYKYRGELDGTCN